MNARRLLLLFACALIVYAVAGLRIARAAGDCFPTLFMVNQLMETSGVAMLENLSGADMDQFMAAHNASPPPTSDVADMVLVFHMPAEPERGLYLIISYEMCIVARGGISKEQYEQLKSGRPLLPEQGA